MDYIDKLVAAVNQDDIFITSSKDYILKHIQSPSLIEYIECLHVVTVNNQNYIKWQEKEINFLNQLINNAKPLVEQKTPSITPSISPKLSTIPEKKNLQEAIEFITYSNQEELKSFLKNLNKEDLIRLKLHFFKTILNLKEDINNTISQNPLADISSKQDSLQEYLNILKTLTTYKETLTPKQEPPIAISNIIIVPNKNSSFLLDDITSYKERSKEIKNAFDKIIAGYFLQTKDLKSIESTKEHVAEYRNPNGLRILYIIKDNLIYITSLFFKDKQKSSKITNEYDEAQRRFYTSYEYIKENFTNPDFHIEQAELIGQINSFLENDMTLLKKVGDYHE